MFTKDIVLFKIFQVMNAEQFTLPNELKPNEQLPFTWKWADERKSKKTNMYHLSNIIWLALSRVIILIYSNV